MQTRSGLLRIKSGGLDATGELVLTTLPFIDELASDIPQAVTAKKLFLNMVEEGWE